MKKTAFSAKKSAALFLACCMAVSMAACTKQNDSSQGSSSSNAESTTGANSDAAKTYDNEITIDLFTQTGNYNGEIVGWGGKVIKDNFNMKVNVVAQQGDESVFQTRAISGNLGDIAIFSADQNFRDSIEAGLLLDMNKDDLFKNHGKDVAKYADAVKHVENTYGGLYAIPGYVSERSALTPSEATEITFGSFVRFDLYQKMGSPEVKTLDDLYPMLKEMAKLEPATPTGEKVYAFSLFGDWDGSFMTFGKQFGSLYGYNDILGGGGYILQNNMGDDYYHVLDPEGYYVKGLKIYNQAYRDGLLQPDSMTQTWDNVRDQLTSGQVLFTCWSWLAEYYNTPANTSEGKAMMFVPITDEKIASDGCRKTGNSYRIGIGTNAKDPERMMDFINWLYSVEGKMTTTNGPEGLSWEMKDGKPTLTEFGLKVVPNNTTDEVPAEYGGGTWQGGGLGYFTSVIDADINPETNQTYTWRVWDSYLDSHTAAVDKRWTAYENWTKQFGAKTQKEYLEKNNQLAVWPGSDMMAPALGADLDQLRGQIQPIVREYSWQMVYAKDDAEFDKLLKEMTTKCEGLGIEKLDKFYIDYLTELAAANEKIVAASN